MIPFRVRFCALHLLILIAVGYFGRTRAFNLATKLPVIKRGQNNGSYFGYAVAAHQIRSDPAGPITEGLMLVGAPLDKNLQPETNRSGALWRCPLTSDPNDCTQVVTDGRREIDESNLYPPLPNEIKEDQWLGVTVKSQGAGGKVLVCAHRYLVKTIDNKNDSAIDGLGLCYLLRQDLEFEGVYVECKGRQKGGGHLDYGACQSGTSGLIFDDDIAIIGAPGTMTWRGAIFVFSIAEDYLTREKTIYIGNGTELKDESSERIKKFGYMGMSLAAGYFNGDKNMVYVAGAPRANETGQVVLFRKAGGVMFRKTGDWNLEEYLIIPGEQIASNFGYQVLAADVNGDRLPDLIVAAPFYFNPKSGEGGAVYIYLNDHENHLRDTIPVKLTGKLDSRFGFAMSTLGDLNKDGYEDVVIGAPYEGNGAIYVYLGSKDGLIIQPSQVVKAEMLTTQIPISTFGYSLSGGLDLDENGYPDLLIGAYEKDLVVLLRARPIIGFRTRIKSPTNLTNFDPANKYCEYGKNNINLPCFQFQTCCVIESVVETFKNRELHVIYTLEAETFDNKRTTSRVWFDDAQTKNSKIEKELVINNTKDEFCQTHIAYLKENVQDIQSPIQMRMSFALNDQVPVQAEKQSLISLDNYPILNQQEANKLFNQTFLKNCGSNYVCESLLVVNGNFSLEPLHEFLKEYPRHYQLVLGERQKVLLNVSVSNLGESAYEAKLYVELPKGVNFGQLLPTPGEKKQYVYSIENGSFVCQLGNPLKERETVHLQLELDLQKVDESEPSLDFKIFANTTSVDDNPKELNQMVLKVKVIEKTNLSISGVSVPEEIPEFINTRLKPESEIEFKDEIGSKVTHYYTILNSGAWRVSNVRVEIEWPYQVANDKEQGKWLLYMDEHPIVEGSGGTGWCEITSDFINPLQLKDRPPQDMYVNYTNRNTIDPILPGDKSQLPEKTNQSSMAQYNRVKRDVEMVVRPETYTNRDGKTYKIVKMNCVLGSAKCKKFSCYLKAIESKQFLNIIIKSRLWDATLIEDYANVDQIKIASRAKMHIPESKVTLQNEFSNEFQVETHARVTLHGQQSAAPVPLYILIAAILIGLLLFILLTLLLWKLGFFKRRRPDPTLSGNLEKHRIDEYHDY